MADSEKAWIPDRELRQATAWPARSCGRGAFLTGTAASPLTATPPPAGEPPAGEPPAIMAGIVYRQVAGVDALPRPMTEPELAELGDPMAALLLRRGTFPLTLTALLAALAESAPDRDVIEGVFLVSESGQIPPDAAPAPTRDPRFAILCAVQGRETDLLISTGATEGPTFLQVAAWDDRAGVFNYYMRITGTWIWTGDSWSALAPESRGQGCFDSHVNGSVVMKELRQPWLNWQSMSATIQLAAGDPLRRHPLYPRVAGAEELEKKVEALVSRWTAARLAKVVRDGMVQHPDHLLRQLLTTTTVNLASTETESAAVTRDPILPMGFWFNKEALVDMLDIPVDAPKPAVPAALYLQSLVTYEFRLEETASGFTQPGDTFFAFVVPEAAYEDNDVIRQLVLRGLMPAKFAACALMVDFPNPVFSPARAALMRYVPTGATPSEKLFGSIADAIVHAAKTLPSSSPEAQFAANWTVPDPDWPDVFGRRLTTYLEKIGARIGSDAGFDDYVRLAESRRRDFRAMKLHEFALTLPVTTIAPDATPLQMAEDGTVSART